ncbi:MAG TPA: hypothetical protein VMX14_13355 [Anaerolineae bacterium]|nr:hypothetical protein [Anaerolineae bacterium]
MSEYITNALFCLAGLSAGATFGFLVHGLLRGASRRLDQHTQEPR